MAAKIANAQDAIRTEILTFLIDNKAAEPVFEQTPSCRRRHVGVADVVVTPELKRWHAFQTLRGVYQDSYGHQSNDRYQWKWQEYGTLARTAKAKCLEIGIGLVADPIPRAQIPVVTNVPGAGDAAALYFAVSLVNALGQEGVASEAVMASLAAGTQAEVHLNAPPSGVQGWNVYAGSGPGSLMRQNSEALAVSISWIQPGILTAGSAPGDGQAATFYAVQNRVIRRG